jgi:hypothetical protein
MLAWGNISDIGYHELNQLKLYHVLNNKSVIGMMK